MTEDRECRILVVSATLDQAKDAVKLIKLIVDDDSADLPPSNDDIPWTIKNKYYSADVHFHLVEYASWDPQLALRVPAIVFVWTRGQPYAEQVFQLHKALSRSEPEVTLAIALGSEPPHHDDPPEGPDSFLADHGFEYIDGERTRDADRDDDRPDRDRDTGGGEGDEDPVPGLPRVIDALSTIMWPSMVRRGRDNSGGGRKGQAAPLTSPFDFDVLHTEEGGEEVLAALMEADAADSGAPQTRAIRMQKEMATLERWLIENEELHEAGLGESISLSPTGIDGGGDGDENDDDALRIPAVRATSGDPWLSHDSSAPHTVTRRDGAAPGFDDDFSAFVSAPAVSVSSAASASAPGSTLAPTGPHGLLDASTPMLQPSHTGGSYRSLRSGTSGFHSDFDDHAGYEALDDRGSFFSLEHEFDDADADPDPDLRTPVGRQLGGERVGLTDARAPFDLTDILASLQTMREDVAGIEDEAQRKAATARFASEFVVQRMGVDGGEKEGTRG